MIFQLKEATLDRIASMGFRFKYLRHVWSVGPRSSGIWLWNKLNVCPFLYYECEESKRSFLEWQNVPYPFPHTYMHKYFLVRLMHDNRHPWCPRLRLLRHLHNRPAIKKSFLYWNSRTYFSFLFKMTISRRIPTNSKKQYTFFCIGSCKCTALYVLNNYKLINWIINFN